MKRSIKIILPHDPSLKRTVTLANAACNDCMAYGYEHKTSDRAKIHKATYKRIRRQYKLSSSIVCALRDQACEMLKREELVRLPVKKSTSSIRYNQRTFTFSMLKGLISLSTIDGRKKYNVNIRDYYQKYISWKPIAATLSYSSQPVLMIILETETPSKLKPTHYLGIDVGIRNIAVTSSHKFYNSTHLRNVKSKYQYLRTKLQRKGTRSAKRLLAQISAREKRFVSDVNHCISKDIVQSNYDTFVLEKLDIRQMRKAPKHLRKLIHRWAPAQLLQYIEYKAEGLGKNVITKNPKYTSQRCSHCGYIDKRNRNGSLFNCISCGFTKNADLNASDNIAYMGISQISRLLSTSHT